jgi:peptidoglycan/xylan/chitin deacetylase (PgdA/CDA1 family)
MLSSKVVRRALFRYLDPLLGGVAIAARKRQDAAFILLYHRVSAEDTQADYAALRPREFVEHLHLIKDLFTVVPLHELVERLAAGRSLQGCCSLTFDDGFADFMVHALPALLTAGLPVTQFLIGDSVRTGRPPWNLRLMRLLRLDPEGARGSPEEVKAMPWRERDEYLCEWESRLGHVFDPMPAMLTSEDVKQLVRAGVEVGSHTQTHGWLAHVAGDEADRELRVSRQWLGELTGRPVRFVSYPQNSYNDAVVSCARAAGYSAGFAVDQRLARNGDDLHRLPRLDLTDRPTSMLRLELSGVIPSMRRLVSRARRKEGD